MSHTNSKPMILIVDDDASMVRTTAMILDRKGYNVDTAEGGARAIEMVQEREYGVIFLDIKMPVMDGVETNRRIKEICPEAVVMMMTAYAVEELVEQALDEGACGILYKPLDIDRMLEIIEEAEVTGSGTLVLVVDDNPAIGEALQQVLTKNGHVVGVASTGEEAIAMAVQEAYDVLFIDLKLPAINGLETYLAIKKVNPEAVAVIMTAYLDELSDLVDRALEEDAYALLRKPFDIEDVLGLVEEITGRK